MDRFRGRMLAVSLLLWAVWGPCGASAPAQMPAAPAGDQPRATDHERGEPPLPPALPDLSEESPAVAPQPSIEPEAGLPAPTPGAAAVPLRLGDAIRRSLANVQTVQANVAVRTAQVAQFDALKEFIPLVTLPQIFVGFNRFAGAPGTNIIFPDVTGGTPLSGLPGMDHVQLSRMFLSFPLDPSGHITALPIAEEGIHVKLLMEQLVRRSQAALAIQRYFQAKQIPYGIRVARRGVTLAQETRLLVGASCGSGRRTTSSSTRRRSKKVGPACCCLTWRRTRGSPSASSPWSCTRAACSCPSSRPRCRSTSTVNMPSISRTPTRST